MDGTVHGIAHADRQPPASNLDGRWPGLAETLYLFLHHLQPSVLLSFLHYMMHLKHAGRRIKRTPYIILAALHGIPHRCSCLLLAIAQLLFVHGLLLYFANSKAYCRCGSGTHGRESSLSHLISKWLSRLSSAFQVRFRVRRPLIDYRQNHDPRKAQTKPSNRCVQIPDNTHTRHIDTVLLLVLVVPYMGTEYLVVPLETGLLCTGQVGRLMLIKSTPSALLLLQSSRVAIPY